MFARENDRLVVMVILQVDESVVVRLKAFVEKEDEQSKAFLSKPKQILHENPTTFK